MKRIRRKVIPVLLVITGLWFLPGTVSGLRGPGDFDFNRGKLIAHVMRQQLPRHHFSHKDIDDQLSKTAFDILLKKVDSQKRFLLQSDVDRLTSFAERIDDEVNLGEIQLPGVVSDVMAERVPKVQAMVKAIMDEPFDFTADEYLETEAKNLTYCVTDKELVDRWRRVLKYQTMIRYLNIEEDEETKKKEPKEGEDSTPLNEEEMRAKAREKVLKNFDELFSRMSKESERDYYDRYFDALANAFDPHTTYMPPASKEDFDISMRGSLEGIGALLREEDGYIKVVRVIPGSAASRQGELQAEDIILEVAQASDEPVEITDMKLRDAVGLIRGEKGTEVRLTIRKPDGTRKVIPIIRDVVQLEATFVRGTVLEPGDESNLRIGYVKIPAFYRDFEKTRNGGEGRNSTDDVRAELDKLTAKGVDALVLDLRNNGGGALTDAVSIAGLFIESGPVVQVKSSNDGMKVLKDTDETISYRGPLVLLVNKFSASASEILAGALQDYGRAVIVGSDHTHGKGTVQTLFDLDRSLSFRKMDQYKPLGAMKITIQKFYRVSGASTQFRGIIPDIVLPDRFQHVKSGEQYLDNSLPWDTVKATDYDEWSPKGLPLDILKAKSRERVASSEEFREIAEEAERARKRTETTLQSLRLETVRQEREEARSVREGRHGEDMGDAHSEGADTELDDEAEEEKFREKLREDAYVLEGAEILRDLLTETRVVSSSSPRAGQKM